MKDEFWPPKVTWARELGWVRVRDPWGEWHEIPLREAPTGYGRLASLEKLERQLRARRPIGA